MISTIPLLLLSASLALATGACSKEPASRPAAKASSKKATPSRMTAAQSAPPVEKGGLPVVGTLGARPEKLAGPVVTVSVDENGKVEVGGKQAADWKALTAALSPLAPAHRGSAFGMKPNQVQLVIHADRRVPWGIVQWVMEAAAGPPVRIDKILFSVRGPKDPAERTFAAYLPHNVGLSSNATQSHTVHRVVALRSKRGGRLLLRALHAAVARDVDAKKTVVVTIRATPEVPIGDVLAAADTVLRSGTGNILFRGIQPPEAGKAFTQAAKKFLSSRARRSSVLTVDRIPLARVKDARPIPPGRVGSGVEGITNPGPIAPVIKRDVPVKPVRSKGSSGN